jgi:outer membrane receptor for ferrienterochelin and colicins
MSKLNFCVSLSSVAMLFLTFETCYAQGTSQLTSIQEPIKSSKPSKPTTNEKLQKVEVKTSKDYDPRRFDTASKIVITDEEISRFGDTDLLDILKRLPSISVVDGGIRMRGLGSGYTQVLLNGQPSPPGFTVESIPPDLIERIEIVRSASAEFSTQAIAGTINVILKKAITLAQRTLKTGMSARGDFLSGANASLQLADKIEEVSYSVPLNVNFNRFKNLENTSQLKQLNATGFTYLLRDTKSANYNHSRSVSLSPRINWAHDSNGTLTADSYISAGNNSGQNRLKINTLIGITNKIPIEDYDTYSEYQNVSGNLSYIRKLEDSAKWDMRVGASTSRSNSSGRTLGKSMTESPLFDRRVTSSGHNRGINANSKYTAPYIENHAISLGGEMSIREQMNTNATRGTTAIQEQVTPINLDENAEIHTTRLAFFAQDEWTLTKNFSLYLGARWEALETKGKGNMMDEVHHRSSVWSPIFQTLLKIPDHNNIQLRFALARTYKAVNTNSLFHRRYYSTNNSATSPDSIANPALKPELSTGFDVGIEHFFTGGVLSANVFVRNINGITLNQLSNIGGVWVTMPINAGHAVTRGLELEMKLPLKLLYNDAPEIDIRMNAGFNSSRLDSVAGPNNRLASQVPLRVNIGTDYKLTAMPLTIGGNFSFQNFGQVRISQNQRNYSTVSRSLDAFALWKFDRMTNLRFSLSNLIQRPALSENIYTDTTGSIIQSSRNPSKINMRLNFEHRF